MAGLQKLRGFVEHARLGSRTGDIRGAELARGLPIGEGLGEVFGS
ncbi:hypothetical protein [Pyrobaculum islandicum]|nr:hypothetical protein [Pyrobaculum islandicum]